MKYLDQPLHDYIPARTLSEHSKGLFKQNATDWMIRNRHRNGLHRHIKKVNGKLFLSLSGFDEWFENHQA